MQFQRVIMTPRALEPVFAYLSDFRTTADWDPGTRRTTRLSGDGGPGTRYLNTICFGGREIDLEYVVTDLVANHHFVLHGHQRALTIGIRFSLREAALDTSGPMGTRVTFTGNYTFEGSARMVSPLLTRSMQVVCDEGARGLQAALLRLPLT